MKFSTISRHIKEGAKNLFRNGWMSVASLAAVTTTLILVAAFLAIMLNLNQMANKIEEDVQINVFIDQTADDVGIEKLGKEIKALDKVKTAKFSSKDEMLKSLMDSFGDEGKSFDLIKQDNPLNHEYKVKAKDPKDTPTIAKQIDKLDNVQEVNYQEDTIKRVFEFNKYARTIGLVLIIGLVFTAMFLISNTIKLTIMARSREIGIMKLVGATNRFIRGPFLMEGFFLGVLGSIVPIAFILTGYYYLFDKLKDQIKFDFVDLLPYNPFAWQLSLIVLVLGGLIGVFGSVMSIRKFLKI